MQVLKTWKRFFHLFCIIKEVHLRLLENSDRFLFLWHLQTNFQAHWPQKFYSVLPGILSASSVVIWSTERRGFNFIVLSQHTDKFAKNWQDETRLYTCCACRLTLKTWNMKKRFVVFKHVEALLDRNHSAPSGASGKQWQISIFITSSNEFPS